MHKTDEFSKPIVSKTNPDREKDCSTILACVFIKIRLTCSYTILAVEITNFFKQTPNQKMCFYIFDLFFFGEPPLSDYNTDNEPPCILACVLKNHTNTLR